MELSITDIYRVLRDAVKYFPQSPDPVRVCRQLQTFRVLQRDPRTNAEVGTDTLGATPADKDSPFFYSRKWELSKFNPNALGFNYPVLTAFEMSNETVGSIFVGQYNRTYFLEFAVLDVYRPDKTKGRFDVCEARSINQIFLDTEFLLDSAIKYLGGAVIATTSIDPVEKVYFKPFLDEAVAQGDITSFDVKFHVGPMLSGLNPNLRFVRVEYPAKSLYGTKVQIKFKTSNCETVTFNPDALDLGVIGFEVGCD